jgi:hypothetical protein
MEVLLKFFEDDSGSGPGLAHDNSIDREFNSFFSAIGIFHDIMEHYFEDIHPYFRGEYSFNYGGEIAATGHMLWYHHGLCLGDRLRDLNGYGYNTVEDFSYNNVSLIDELSLGWTRFGDELLCKIPKNPYVLHPNYSSVVQEHWYRWEQSLKEPIHARDAEDTERAQRLRKSLSLSKLQRLYGWGYYTAKRMFPQTDHNMATIQQLYDDLKRFTKYSDREELMNTFTYLRAYINPGKKFTYKLRLVDNYYREEHDIFNWENTLKQ